MIAAREDGRAKRLCVAEPQPSQVYASGIMARYGGYHPYNLAYSALPGALVVGFQRDLAGNVAGVIQESLCRDSTFPRERS